MQKTYWWRGIILLLSGGIVLLGWIYDTYFCFVYSQGCPLDQLRLAVFEPVIFLSLSILIVSPFLFFINDNIFKKWLQFALVWILVSMIFITATPVSYHSFMNPSPDREMTSILMSVLFVVISIAKISWDIWKAKRHKVGN